MNISKNIRLLFGLVILFSMIFFIGTESTGCSNCVTSNTANNAKIIMINNNPATHKFVISGVTNLERIVNSGGSTAVWVEKGSYTVYAWGYSNGFNLLSGTFTFSLSPGNIKTITIE